MFGVLAVRSCCQLQEPQYACCRSVLWSVAVRLLANRPSVSIIHGASSDSDFVTHVPHTWSSDVCLADCS